MIPATPVTNGLRCLGLCLLACLTAPLWCACGASEEGVHVSLRGTEEAPAPEAGSPAVFRVGIGAMISPAATIELYGQLVDRLGHRLGRRGVAVQRGTYAEINELLEQRRLDCALVCTGAYMTGHAKFGMEALLVPVFDGSPTYHSLIIAREDSGIESFADLRGKRFAFVDPLSNTGRAYPTWKILKLGDVPESFFNYQYTHAHDKSIHAVRAGVVDAAAVDELIFKHLQRSNYLDVKGLKILDRSPPFGAPPVVIHPDTVDAERSAIRAAFLDLQEKHITRWILDKLGIDGFVVPPKGLYDSVREMNDEVRRLAEEAGGR